MKKTKKTIHARMLSLILTMAMALAVLPSAASATSTSTLDQLRETHPAGSYFRTYYQNGQEMAWECMGYAYQLMYEAYGTYMYSGYDNYDVNYCLDNLKAGDVIRYAPNGIRHSISPPLMGKTYASQIPTAARATASSAGTTGQPNPKSAQASSMPRRACGTWPPPPAPRPLPLWRPTV